MVPNPSPDYRLGKQLLPDTLHHGAQQDNLVTSCANSDFSEGNFYNWTGCYGGFSSPCDNVGFEPTRHVIMPRANQVYDPFIGSPLTTLFPGETYSARLGDTLEGSHSEQLRYTVSVTPEHYLFIYRWAAVLESVGHEPWQMPKFSLQVEDMAGNAIGGSCGFYEFVAPNCSPPGPSCIVPAEWHYVAVPNPSIDLYWHDWTTIALDLSPFISAGNVQIVFTTRGCAMQIHRGYAYLSTYCSPLANQISMCANSLHATLTAPPGFTTYAWRGPGLTGPPIGNTQSIVINNPLTNDIYYVNLTAANGCEVNDLSQEIRATTVNAAFTVIPHCPGEATEFLDVSTINQNDVVYWHWMFGDGQPDLGGIPNPTHVYALAGTYTVTLNAYSTDGCLGSVSQQITISAPVPRTLTGSETACTNGAGLVYTTEAGMTGYVWNFPAGTVVLAGGTAASHTATLSWSSPGSYTIGVNYTNPMAVCSSAPPATVSVIVGALAPPEITGENAVCLGAVGMTYTTQPGKVNYLWTVPAEATVTAGGTTADDFITVTWNQAGIFNISVIYTEPSTLCSPAAPTDYSVTVIALQPPTFINGSPVACVGTGAVTYTTQPGKVNYIWTLPSGAQTVAGGTATDNYVSLAWISTGNYILSVNYSEPVSLCTSLVPAILAVTAISLPGPAGNIIGPDSVCRTTSVTYSVLSIPNAASCQWTYSGTGVNITGNGNNSIGMEFTANATGGLLSVKGVNNCGDGAASAPLAIAVNKIPEVGFTPCFDLVTTPAAKKFRLRGGTPYVTGQGIFSGNRVSYNPVTGFYEFNPQGAVPGSYLVSYSFTSTAGCTGVALPVTITVQANPFVCGGELTDVRDGKKYQTVLLSDRCWMQENLGYGIRLVSPGTIQSDNCLAEKYCAPDDALCSAYGGLYMWDELMDYAVDSYARGICPPEWHVPSEPEWQYLIDNLVPGTPLAHTSSTMGSKLKDPWLDFGFRAVLNGLDYNNSQWAFYSGFLTGTMFWTSSVCSPTHAVARGLNSMNQSVSHYCNARADAFSVRCVKD